MKDTIVNPVFGQTYMASRYHSSKRIIKEPFRFDSDRAGILYKYTGVWLIDNQPGSVSSLYEFDPKWVERKIKDLNNEIADATLRIWHLQNIRH
jgi:hypothetical protein